MNKLATSEGSNSGESEPPSDTDQADNNNEVSTRPVGRSRKTHAGHRPGIELRVSGLREVKTEDG